MALELSGAEKELLVTLLNKEYQETLVEIRHSVNNNFKDMLKSREAMLEGMLTKLQ